MTIALRDQAELVEAVGDRLLRRDDLVVDAPIANDGALGRDGLDLESTPVTSASDFADLVAMGFRPVAPPRPSSRSRRGASPIACARNRGWR